MKIPNALVLGGLVTSGLALAAATLIDVRYGPSWLRDIVAPIVAGYGVVVGILSMYISFLVFAMKKALLISTSVIVGVGVLLFLRWGSYGDLTSRSKVAGAKLEISDAIVKLAEACKENALKPGMTHRELGLNARSEEWALVRDITFSFGAPESGSLIATLGPVYDDAWPVYRKVRIKTGSTLAFRVTCKDRRFEYETDPEKTTVPRDLLPSSMRVR